MVRKRDSRSQSPRQGTTRTEGTLEQPYLQLPMSEGARREPQPEPGEERAKARAARPAGSHVVVIDLVGDPDELGA